MNDLGEIGMETSIFYENQLEIIDAYYTEKPCLPDEKTVCLHKQRFARKRKTKKKYCYIFRKSNPFPNFSDHSILPLQELVLPNIHEVQEIADDSRRFQIRQLSFHHPQIFLVIDWIQPFLIEPSNSKFNSTSCIFQQKSMRLALQLTIERHTYRYFVPTLPRKLYGQTTKFRWVCLQEDITQIFAHLKNKLLNTTEYELSIYLTQPGQTWEVARWKN